MYALFKRAVAVVSTSEEHLDREISILHIIITFGIVTLSPNAKCDLLGGEFVEFEDTGIITETLGNVESRLTVNGGALVGLPNSGRTAVLIGNTDGTDYVSFYACFGSCARGGSVLTFDLYGLTGEMNPHIGSCNKPNLEFYK